MSRAWKLLAAGLCLVLGIGLTACGGGADGVATETAGRAATAPPDTKQAQAFRSATNFTGNGWYWNPAEPGTGFMFEAQGDAAFVGFFMYEADTGKAVWYAAYGFFLADDTGRHFFFGDLRRYSGGQPISSATVPAGGASTSLGPVSITFPAPGGATVILPGGRSIAATRFDFNGLTGTPKSFQPETGWYWNPAQGGRGYAIEVQNDRLFMAMFHYNEDGSPTWHLVQGDLASGALVAPFEAYDGGQSLTAAFVPGGTRNLRGGFALGFRQACGGQVQRAGAAPVTIQRFAIPDSGLAPGAECRSSQAAADVAPAAYEPDWSDALKSALADLPVFHAGDGVDGRLDAVPGGDADAHRFWLEAGESYLLRVVGAAEGAGTLAQPILSLHDARGTPLASDAVNGSLSFTPTFSGVHVLMVRAAAGRNGLYRLTVSGASGELRLPLTTGAGSCASTVQGVLRGGDSGSFSIAVHADGSLGGSITLASAPAAPLVVAGSVSASGRVTLTAGTSLSATGYFGPDGDLTGTWSTLPGGAAGGSLVGDCSGARVLDNRPPEPGAVGTPSTFTWGNPPALSRTGANVDADGDLVKAARWRLVSKPAGSAVALRPGAFPKSLDADLPGDYVLEMIVHDGKADSVPVRATVRAVPANALPVANAGADRVVAVGAQVSLDGSASLDVEGPLSFRWEVVDQPAGAGLSYTPDVAARPQLPFFAPLRGHYLLRLTVSDGVSVASDDVSVVAQENGLGTPLGAPQNLRVGIGSSIRLQGLPGSIANLVPQWRLTGSPQGSASALVGNAGDLAVSLTPDTAGRYALTLSSLDLATGAVVGNVATEVQAFDLSGNWSGQIGPDPGPGASLFSFSTDAGGALVGRLSVGFFSCGQPVRLLRQFSAAQRLFDASGNTTSFRFTGGTTVSTMTASLRSASQMTGTLALRLPATPDCPAQNLVLPWQATR